MLNLRQLNKADNTQTNSDPQHFSRFSVDFRVPSDLLGNIGEPLDHGQSERLHEDEPEDHAAAADEQPRGMRDLENTGLVARPSGPRLENEDSDSLATSWLAAGPSGTRSDEASMGDATPNARPFCVRDGTVGNASRQSCKDITDSYGVNVPEQVRNLLFS